MVFRGLDIDRAYQTSLVDALIAYDRPGEADRNDNYVVSNKEPGGYAPYGRLQFHSDMMWAPEPFQVLSLYGLEVELPSVPTAFVSTTAAWDTLPADLRARVEELHVVNVTGQQRRGADDDEDLLDSIREHEQSITTPVGHRHPRTGRTLLYVSQMNTREIVELPHDESEELIEALFAHLYDPAHVMEHDWRQGDLVGVGQPGRAACPQDRADRGAGAHAAQGHQPDPLARRHRRDPEVLQGRLTPAAPAVTDPGSAASIVQLRKGISCVVPGRAPHGFKKKPGRSPRSSPRG